MNREPHGASFDFDQLRDRTLNDLLLLFCVLITPAVAVSVSRAAYLGWSPLFSIQLSLLALLYGLAALRKRIPYGWRIGIFLTALWCNLLFSHTYLGLLADSRYTAVVVILVVMLLLPLRWAWGVAGVFVLTIGAVGAGFVNGLLTNHIDYELHVRQTQSWITTIYSLIGTSAIVTMVAMRIIDVLRQALAAAKDSDARLREAQALAHLGSWDYQARDQRLIWSDETYRLLGVEPGAPVRLADFTDRVHPGDRPEVDRAWQWAMATGVFDSEHRIIVRDETRWVRQHARLSFGPDEHLVGAVGTLQDITLQKVVERAMQGSEARFRSIFERANTGIAFTDAEGFLLQFNDSFAQLVGYSPEALRGMNFARLSHPGDLAVETEYLNEILAGGRDDYRMEKRYLTRSGGVVWVDLAVTVIRDANQRPLNLVGMVVDITERHKAETALRSSEEKLRNILAKMPVGLCLVDENDAMYFRNDRFVELLGYTADDVPTTQEWWPRAYPDPAYRQWVLNTWQGAVERATQLGTEIEPHEYRVVCNTGETRIVEISGIVMGKELLVTCVDLTERKQAESALLEAKRAAEAANRAKSEFLSRMSHELRTPLNAVIGFSQLLELDEPDPLTERQKELVSHIHAGGYHLLSLINEVLDLARIEAGRLELAITRVSLDEVIADTLSLMAPLATARSIDLDVAGACHRAVLADAGRLRQVLVNLLSNAIKYSHTGGAVAVTCTEGLGQMRVTVTDNGIGIPADKRALIFQPFERLGAERTGIEGTGIGLTIVKHLVEAMGGGIGFDSVPGRGSAFWVELSMAGEASATQPVAGDAAAGQAVASKELVEWHGSVLYVEDNPANVSLMKHIFRQLPKVRLLIATDAEFGLVLAREYLPDLILLDIHLPEMSGVDALRQLRADPGTASIAVFAVSAAAMAHDIETGLREGFDAYITKPFNVPDLLRRIREVLERLGDQPRSHHHA
ncbi:PAS domain S-box protein [Methylomagnum sp.]